VLAEVSVDIFEAANTITLYTQAWVVVSRD